MLTSHGRNVARNALLELNTPARTNPATPVGLCVMTSKNWWTAAAIGQTADRLLVGASAYFSVEREVETYPTLWHYGFAIDTTALYIGFRDLYTHNPARPPTASDEQLAEVVGLSLRGMQHLMAGTAHFDLENADFLAALTPLPETMPWGWTNPTVPFTSGVSGPDGRVEDEACWVRWVSGALTDSGEETADGKNSDMGLRSLRRHRLLPTPARAGSLLSRRSR